MPTMLATGVQAAVGGAGGFFDIQPPVGQAYCITDFMSDQLFSGDVPDIQVSFRDGVHTDAIILLDPTVEVQRQFRPKEIYINRTTYLRISNEAVGAAVIGFTGHRVNPDNVRTVIETVPNGGTKIIQPADQGYAGEVWRVTELGAEAQVAVINEPDLTINLVDGALNLAMICDGARDSVWDKLLDWYISDAVYLQLAPIAAADNAVGLSMIRVPVEHFADCIELGIGATVAIQPDEGVEAVVTEIASEVWLAAAPAGNPDASLSLTDGVTPATVIEAGSVSDSLIRNRKMALEIDNTVYLEVTNVNAAANQYAYCGYVRREEHTT